MGLHDGQPGRQPELTMRRGAAAILVLAATAGCGLGDSWCGNDLLSSAQSPDARWNAVVFTRSCGATTGYGTQVSLLQPGRPLPDHAGNVFIVAGGNGAPTGPGGGPVVWVSWEPGGRLVQTYHPAVRVFRQRSSHRAVFIEYRVDALAAGHGATGDPMMKGRR